MKHKLLVLLLLITVHFRWDANTEPDLAGYRIFRRPAGSIYDYSIPVADIPCTGGDTSCTTGSDVNVPDGDYYWVVRAYDTEGYESEDSNEQHKLITSVEPSAPSNLTIEREEIVP